MRKDEAFWGILLVVIGGVLLLDRLVGIGFGRAALPLALMAVGGWVLWQTSREHEPLEEEAVSIPTEGVERARIDLDHGLGKLNIRTGTAPGALVTGTFVGGVDVRRRVESDRARLRLRPPRDRWPSFLLPWVGEGRSIDWDMALSEEIGIYLDINGGLSSSKIDLTGLLLEELHLKGGLGSIKLVLPAEAGRSKIRINCGLGSLRVRIPDGVAARIHTTTGLGSTSVDGARFPGSGGRYQSDDYDTAKNSVDLRIQAGLGSVSVR